MRDHFHVQLSDDAIREISSIGLAHLGDAVYELLVRAWLCEQGKATGKGLHRATVEMVKAPAQAKFADRLMPLLTEEEQGYYRRGKNAHSHAAPKSATPQEYAKATGLEALFGALYLLGRVERLNELFLAGIQQG